MSNPIKDTSFVFSAAKVNALPASSLDEVTVIGRSNVGKSSFINRLLARKKLARTSATPGRTKEAVVFKVDLSTSPPSAFHLVDLPGYGFSKVGRAQKEVMHKLIVDYLLQRRQLKVVLLLNDARRMPDEEEILIRDMAFDSGRHLIVVVSKADKLGRAELKKQVQRIADIYGLEAADLVLTGSNLPAESVWDRLLPLLQA